MALYLKYRPLKFDDVVGQPFVQKILQQQVVHERVSHAYLFYGMRGTGKTTVARILAMAVNCQAGDPQIRPCCQCVNCESIQLGNHPDIVEIDAATNRGIDNIRDLREQARYQPAAGFRKVYIIDECHQLTPNATDALLKTLEEPAGTTMFILATTVLHKVIDTIRSRCQRFNFRAVPEHVIAERVRMVATAEQTEFPDATIELISKAACGSVRDGLSLLDMLIQSLTTSPEAVRLVLGKPTDDDLADFVDLIISQDGYSLLESIEALEQTGMVSLVEFRRELIGWFQEMLRVRVGWGSESPRMGRQTSYFTISELVDVIKILIQPLQFFNTQPRTGLELMTFEILGRLPQSELLNKLHAEYADGLGADPPNLNAEWE